MVEKFIFNTIIRHLPFTPNDEKILCLEELSRFLFQRKERSCFLLKGYAGTGKTSVVAALVKAMNSMKLPCILLAPTGRASKVLANYAGQQAYTVHKYIYRRGQNDLDSRFSLGYNKLRNALFIVDEASMISTTQDNNVFGTGNLLDDLISFVYQGEGCRLLLLGDDAQLPPVGQTISPALDMTHLLQQQLDVTACTLTIVARQALDSGILSNATSLRQVLLDNPDSQLEIKPADDVLFLKGNEVVEHIEQSYRKVDMDNTIIITRSNNLANRYNQYIRARILWREEILSSGDRIMISRNNYFWLEDDFLANGEILEVLRLRNEREMYGYRFADACLHSVDRDMDVDAIVWLDTLQTKTPEISYSMQRELYSRIAADYPEIRSRKELYKKVSASPYFNALQIRYAYAVTCHKAQGGQWEHVYLDRGIIQTDQMNNQESVEYLRWLYTAVTRAKEKLYILR